MSKNLNLEERATSILKWVKNILNLSIIPLLCPIFAVMNFFTLRKSFSDHGGKVNDFFKFSWLIITLIYLFFSIPLVIIKIYKDYHAKLD